MMQNQYCHMMDQTAPGEDLIQAALRKAQLPAAAGGGSGRGWLQRLRQQCWLR